MSLGHGYGKEAYPAHSRKREVRKEIIGHTKPNVITLLGRDPEIAKAEMISLGGRRILSFENNETAFKNQLRVKDRRTLPLLGDLNDVFISYDWTYDADMTNTVFVYGELIYKLRDMDTIFTFTLRTMGEKLSDTIRFFMNAHEDEHYRIIPTNDGKTLIEGEKYFFIYKTYSDGAPMIIIRKLWNKKENL